MITTAKTADSNNQSNDEADELDDMKISSRSTTSYSIDESTSECSSSKMTSTPCSEINARNSRSHKNRPSQEQQPTSHEIENKLFLNERFLHQLENLEKIIWNYKQESRVSKKSQSASLPKEIIFKILM